MIVLLDLKTYKTPNVVLKELSGKLCPTQYNSETKEVEVDPSYGLSNGDPCEWIYHEYVHHYVEENVRHYNKEQDNADYPTNQIENAAYPSQFVRLMQKKVTLYDIFTDPKYDTLKFCFQRYPYLYNYWEYASIYLSDKEFAKKVLNVLHEITADEYHVKEV